MRHESHLLSKSCEPGSLSSLSKAEASGRMQPFLA
jgi:hypothetical protein